MRWLGFKTNRSSPKKGVYMAIELQNLPRFTFSSASGGPQSQKKIIGFERAPRSAVVAINGFKIGFTNKDRSLFEQTIDAHAIINSGGDGYNVTVTVTFALRDKSGIYDDPFEGYVDVVLIVDL
jgi:hypothetical protein